jgi:predicted phosphodiesterase
MREVGELDRLIDEINAHDLAFVVHVGDIGTSSLAQACGDAWLEERKKQFARIRHRFILVPGDNEWSDCTSHGLDPVARLRKWRELFCENPGDWCEHQRWEAGNRVFVTLNVPGNNNNRGHPEMGPRMQVVERWLEESARLAEQRDGLVILMQANPFETLRRDGYESLREQLAALGRRMPGRVTLIHGDTHVLRDDEPFPGLRRIEVWGSPFVRWRREPLSAPPNR